MVRLNINIDLMRYTKKDNKYKTTHVSSVRTRCVIDKNQKHLTDGYLFLEL